MIEEVELGVFGGGEPGDGEEGDLTVVVVERWVLGRGEAWSSPSAALPDGGLPEKTQVDLSHALRVVCLT